MRPDQLMVDESARDSLGSSEISSDAFSNNFRANYNNFNHITQHIQNNNNKITIIIKHNEGTVVPPSFSPQVIYIQPVAVSQPELQLSHDQCASNSDLGAKEMFNSLDDLDSEEHYQFYDERAIDVPDDFMRNSYLVLNFNNAANRKLRRRICTPTRNLLPIDDATSRALENNRLRNKAIANQVSLLISLRVGLTFLFIISAINLTISTDASYFSLVFFNCCKVEGCSCENYTD